MKQILLSSLFLLLLYSCNSDYNTYQAELLYKKDATTGEGAIWHPGRQSLFWLDIEGKTLYEYQPQFEKSHQWVFDRMISTVVPETDSTVVLAFQDEIARICLSNKKKTTITSIPTDNGKLRCNDGKCDPKGRLWVGTMSLDGKKKAGALYCITPNGKITQKLDKISISNGIVWSSNRKFMYYNDTPTGKITRYRYNENNTNLLYEGTAVRIPSKSGVPDGMAIDSNDNLWVAQWGGFGVYCYNPYTGDLLAKVEVPAPNVASCAFGGEKMDILYITTARAGLTSEELEKYPLSGSVFACRPGVKGVSANYFGK